MTTQTTDTMEAKDIVKDMKFTELEAIEEACRARMEELRQGGVLELADKFEEMATVVGMTAKEVMSAARKARRGQIAAQEAAQGAAEKAA